MMAGPMARRSFIRCTAMGAAGAVLAACGVPATSQVATEPTAAEATAVVEAPTAAAAAGETVTIRFEDEAEIGPEGFAVFTDVLIPRFQEANPDVTVTFEPATGDWAQKITTQMAAGEAPDVMVAYGNEARTWMESEQLLALEDVIAKEELEDFYEGQLVAFNINNHLYEIPKYVSCIVLAYNKDAFDTAGLEYPTDEWTWDDFILAVEKTTVVDDAGKTTQWGYRIMQNYIAHWVWQNGGEWMDKDAMGTKMLLDEPKALEGLKFNWDILYTQKYSPSAQDMEQVGAFDTFQTGVLGLAEAHSWQVTDYIARNTFNYDYARLPKGVNDVGQIFADGYGIYKGTKYKDAAIAFLQFITNAESETEMCTSALGLQPSRKSVASVWDTESKGAKAGLNVKKFSEMASVARLDPYFKNHAKVREIFTPIWESIWVTGKVGLEEGITELVTKVNEYLATVTG